MANGFVSGAMKIDCTIDMSKNALAKLAINSALAHGKKVAQVSRKGVSNMYKFRCNDSDFSGARILTENTTDDVLKIVRKGKSVVLVRTEHVDDLGKYGYQFERGVYPCLKNGELTTFTSFGCGVTLLGWSKVVNLSTPTESQFALLCERVSQAIREKRVPETIVTAFRSAAPRS